MKTVNKEANTVQYASGAKRSADRESVRYDLINGVGMRRLAETSHEGSIKYGDFNWRQGMPVRDCLNHAIPHIYAYLEGDRSEDHLAHAAWNLFTAMFSEEKWPHLNKELMPPSAGVTDNGVAYRTGGFTPEATPSMNGLNGSSPENSEEEEETEKKSDTVSVRLNKLGLQCLKLGVDKYVPICESCGTTCADAQEKYERQMDQLIELLAGTKERLGEVPEWFKMPSFPEGYIPQGSVSFFVPPTTDPSVKDFCAVKMKYLRPDKKSHLYLIGVVARQNGKFMLPTPEEAEDNIIRPAYEVVGKTFAQTHTITPDAPAILWYDCVMEL